MNSPANENAPAVTVIEITDPSEANAGIELVDLDAVQLGQGVLRARRVVVRAGTTMVAFHSSNIRLRTRTSIAEGLVGYVVFGPRSTGTINGISVQPGLVLAAGSLAEAGFVVDPGWESITFLLPAGDFQAHLAARQRTALIPPPRDIAVLSTEPAVADHLFAWGKRLAETLAAQPALFNDAEAGQDALQVEILENLLAGIGTAKVFEPGRSGRTRQRRSRIVKLAEEYALAERGANLYVTDLCRITGVSERALEYAFKEVMGLTPVAFLMKLRLHRVRHALVAATPGSTTVAAEALRWGFWHFGDFARAYSECFGELPSQTLARNRDCAEGYNKPHQISGS